MANKYTPTVGRVIVKQERATKQGLLYIPEHAQEKSVFATIVAVNNSEQFEVGQHVFFDKSAGSILEDTTDAVYTVLDESDVLATVEVV